MKKRYLILGDGTVFEGEAFGADASAIGELVFTTGMCGYTESLTDPSYAGQILLQTFPMIGNYGVAEEDAEGRCALCGYVVREWCKTPSNFRCEETVDAFLKKNGIPGLCGVDTRQITRRLRQVGVMNAMLTDTLPADLAPLTSYVVSNAVDSVTCRQAYTEPATGERRFSVTLIDYGAKKNIARELAKRACEVTVVPASTPADSILAAHPDGVMLSNGPGDPAENKTCIAQIQKLLGKVPLFGICLGHQLLALACGGKTEKMKYGHRGVNQPVREVGGSRTYITTQNHGYAVHIASPENLPRGASVRFVNANDNTCEGLSYPASRAFSVQFHPEACAGPGDTSFLFDEFISLMQAEKKRTKSAVNSENLHFVDSGSMPNASERKGE